MNKCFLSEWAFDSPYERPSDNEILTQVITRLSRAEGDVLKHLEKSGTISLRELMEALEWESCTLVLAVRNLVLQGLIRSVKRDQEMYLEIGYRK